MGGRGTPALAGVRGRFACCCITNPKGGRPRPSHSLRSRSYRSVRIADPTPKDAGARLCQSQPSRQLRAQGGGAAPPPWAGGVSRPAYYPLAGALPSPWSQGTGSPKPRPPTNSPPSQRWRRSQEGAGWRMRQRSPGRGQKRLTGMRARAGTTLSASPSGRLLAKGRRRRPRAHPDAAPAQLRLGACAARAACPDARPPRRGGPEHSPDRLARGKDAQAVPGTLPRERAPGPAGELPRPRAHRPPLPADRARGAGASGALPPGRRRQRVPGRGRGRRPRTQTALGRATTDKPPAQRRRRTPPPLRSSAEVWGSDQGDLTVRDASEPLSQYQDFYHHVRPHYALDLKTSLA